MHQMISISRVLHNATDKIPMTFDNKESGLLLWHMTEQSTYESTDLCQYRLFNKQQLFQSKTSWEENDSQNWETYITGRHLEWNTAI